jgi:hypothetical protein
MPTSQSQLEPLRLSSLTASRPLLLPTEVQPLYQAQEFQWCQEQALQALGLLMAVV